MKSIMAEIDQELQKIGSLDKKANSVEFADILVKQLSSPFFNFKWYETALGEDSGSTGWEAISDTVFFRIYELFDNDPTIDVSVNREGLEAKIKKLYKSYQQTHQEMRGYELSVWFEDWKKFHLVFEKGYQK